VASWFKKPPDPLVDRARETAGIVADRLTEAFPAVRDRLPALDGTDQATWLRHATVAATSLTIFPLLRSVRGNVPRYKRLVELLRTGLRERFPEADALWAEADRSTVPPTGQEQSRTLAEVDESQALALARWVLIATAGPGSLGRSWQPVRELAKVLQASVRDHWTPD
jgi:hypothetical protein